MADKESAAQSISVTSEDPKQPKKGPVDANGDGPGDKHEPNGTDAAPPAKGKEKADKPEELVRLHLFSAPCPCVLIIKCLHSPKKMPT